MANRSDCASGNRVLPYGFIQSFPHGVIEDKDRNIKGIISYYLCKTQSMFAYDGLPETIPQRILELYLQINGHCAFVEHNGAYYAIQGNFGGELDYNYMPKKYMTVNPYLPGLPIEHNVTENCVVVPNDSLYIGLLPMLTKFAEETAETDISALIALINSRLSFIVSAADDGTEKSAKAFLADLAKGTLGVIRENAFIEGLKINPVARTGSNSILQSLDEHRQYLRGTLYHDLGLDSPFNMKRERIQNAETKTVQDTLLPFIDDMLKSRENAVDAINKMFGLSISVKLASAWEDEQIEREAELEQMQQAAQEPQADKTNGGAENDTGPDE